MEASKEYFLMPTEAKEAFPRHPDIQQGYVRWKSEITRKLIAVVKPFNLSLKFDSWFYSPGREIFDQKEDGLVFVCNSCDAKFTMKSNLRRHIRLKRLELPRF